ncbi:enoyl-CoA hydratase-related protein [Achromobacter insolitus]|jgi:enoyl-CoA hydratase/carnithine racemase|uniref:enoyl-CoA hydratase-related protein n=1 Tax=Achromobacter insolitus TaxID=217204 RepID=UPI0007C372DC|nr:enoyl-CoA hydratase-related protein [Achromobacter insolitus]GLK95544.1 enoyl-CoA hydratase [Achromobacter xylosoxidans]AXA74163.1 enoyl-CoA hydratase [Achromobacter insolitus]MCP1400770.1 enoyl-CoA hydratase/carnithine racemase [Achromobacter insolitus]MDH3062084.1 enoyl-CoA hydratase-related protein [Achromobacter insolitus]OAD17671.1 enoyl-CoA hydratase [Achromobacter insolitus]
MSAGLQVSRDGAVLTLTINRPDRRNALDTATYAALTEQIALASADTAVAAVILTGAGEHFTAGNDLRDFQAERGAGDSAGLTFLRALTMADVPVIAAVEGYAIGIGVTLLQHCDFVYIGDGATLRMPFVALGLCPEGASSLLMPRLAGARRAAEWLLQGKAFTAQEACDAGLATAAVPKGQALAAAQAAAADLARQPPAALRLTKAMLRRPDRQSIQDTLDYEAQQFRIRLQSEEAQAAFAKFFKK